MIVTTTNNVEGKVATKYLGIVTGEAIIGANFIKDIFASITDIVGGRSAAYERSLREAKDIALKELEENAMKLGANGVLAVDLDYETIGKNGGMLMVSASGTAVFLH
jgi:uncharacterized protein YbjQ (UPF0145 family)